MKHHNLRIAWSVLWGIAAVLLAVLWVRSYWWHDAFWLTDSNYRATGVSSSAGAVAVETVRLAPRVNAVGWHFTTGPVDSTYTGFIWKSSAAYTLVGTPTSLPLFVSLMVATFPWIGRQFSLRTLLIAMTLTAIALGLIACSR
jgi:hypothetical protein